MRYLALGDSYTICTGASSPAQRWPTLLAGRLEQATGGDVAVTNLGVDGNTTSQLIDHQLPHLEDASWDLISVLIGVNDFFQGYDEPHYRSRLERIYDAVACATGARVLAVSIPDYSYTPVGRASGDPQTISNGLCGFNATARAAAAERGFTWADIFELSRSRVGEAGWIALDGLHPGDVQYRAWADHVWSVLRAHV